MKKLLLGICAILLLPGAQALATPFLTNGSVVSSTITIGADSWNVTNLHQSGDLWNGGVGGYSYNGSGFNFTGYYLGTFTGHGNLGNTSDTTLDTLASYYLGTPVDPSYYSTGGSSGPLTITTDPGGQSGTWTTTNPGPAVDVSFYAVKAGNYFALYLVDPALDSGLWTTADILVGNGEIPSISHLDVLTGSSTPVPEPATMLLFGTGLAGLAGIARRKTHQK